MKNLHEVLAYSITVMLFLIIHPWPTFSWYDTSTTPDDIYTYGERSQGKEHVPQMGTHVIGRHKRTDEDWLKLARSFKVFQTANKTDKEALLKHFHNKPVIGQFLPRSGPATGGTKIRVWGTNFGNGKGVYKCRFGQHVVKAKYETMEEQPTISCKAPAFVKTKSREKGVQFSIIIFSHSKTTVDHIASHSRKFIYYSREDLEPTILSAAPLSGPLSGGTMVTFQGSNLRGGNFYNCRFGNEVVPAKYPYGLPSLGGVNERLTCKSPTYSEVGNVDLDLVLAGVNPKSILSSEARFTFSYYRASKKLKMSKVAGLMSGGTEIVIGSSMLRAGFQRAQSSNLKCRFGKKIITDASLMHDGRMVCVTPKYEQIFPLNERNDIETTRPADILLEEKSNMRSDIRGDKSNNMLRKENIGKIYSGCTGFTNTICNDNEDIHEISDNINDSLQPKYDPETLISSKVAATKEVSKAPSHMISDTVDALSSIESMMNTKDYLKDDCKDVYSDAEFAVRNFIKNITSHDPMQYCVHMHTIKSLFCHDAIKNCKVNEEQKSLQSYACSVISVVYDKYYKVCRVKPKVIHLPSSPPESPPIKVENALRPQQAVSKVVPKPVPLKNKLNIFEPCEVFVNLILMNRASVIYGSGGKSSVIPALGLQYTGLHCFEKAKTNYDMVCIYEMEANTDPNRTVGGPYEPIFQDGYKLQFYPTGELPIPNNFRYIEGKIYTIRYEHKVTKNSTCTWVHAESISLKGKTKMLHVDKKTNSTIIIERGRYAIG